MKQSKGLKALRTFEKTYSKQFTIEYKKLPPNEVQFIIEENDLVIEAYFKLTPAEYQQFKS